MYNDVWPVAPANADTEKPTMRGRGRDRGKERARGRGHGRVVPVVIELPNYHVSMNENSPAQ